MTWRPSQPAELEALVRAAHDAQHFELVDEERRAQAMATLLPGGEGWVVSVAGQASGAPDEIRAFATRLLAWYLEERDHG